MNLKTFMKALLTKELEETLGAAVDEAVMRRHEYVTLEHLLYALINDRVGRDVLVNCGVFMIASVRSPP